MILKKVCMVGDFGVGKTSLVRRFLDQQFSDHYLSTIGVKISRKLLSVSSQEAIARQIQLMIWDIEGETQFQPIIPSYLEGASGAIIVADLNRLETIEHIPKHIELVCSVNPKGISCIIALNKLDILKKEGYTDVLESIASLQTHPQVVQMFQTSAKTGEQVEVMFQTLAQSLFKNHVIGRKPQPF
ncbi:GTP-binding protein [Merismopedia glauca CCAP 1448/3]|uniref:GTP-binding protein n=1 Tax=Merismopedia glauca CCAP 1448/3 TaxID=1296344 RepID=A0A2T1BXF0_9CYAN|nr:GTP-binding protein [Merismopedia glauca CCAP 1448/3]